MSSEVHSEADDPVVVVRAGRARPGRRRRCRRCRPNRPPRAGGAGVRRRRPGCALRAARAGARRGRAVADPRRDVRPHPPTATGCRRSRRARRSRGRCAPSSASATARRSRTRPRAPPTACSSKCSSSTTAAGPSARTWTIDATRTPADDDTWRLADAESLSSADGLNRLALDPNRQFRVRDLAVRAEDLLLTFPSGVAYVATTADGETGMVVIGDGTMQFTPKPAMEQDAAAHLLRRDRAAHADRRRLPPLPPHRSRRSHRGHADRGAGVGVDACAAPRRSSRRRSASRSASSSADLSRERWSLVPPVGDFLAEIRTKGRFGTLTYVRSGGEPEDISLFQRARQPQRRRLRVGAAPEDARHAGVQRGRRSRLRRLALLDRRDDRSRSPADRGPHRDAADGARRRRRHADLQAGRIAERLRRRRQGLGRLLALRVRGQNAVLVNLPRTLVRGTTVTLTIAYGGRLAGASPDREAVARAAGHGAPRGAPSPPSRASSTAIAATGTRRRRSPTTRPACCG